MLDPKESVTLPESLTLRECGESDIDELIRIRMDFLRVDFVMTEDEEHSLMRELGEYYPSSLGCDLFAFCAFDKGVIVSSVFLVISKRPPNPVIPNGLSGYISNVYTDPAYRGQGLATSLLAAARSKAQELKLSSMDLIATDKGRPLYEKMGFIKNDRYMRLRM
jgi:GNAT superfamily N-acetyltransferase